MKHIKINGNRVRILRQTLNLTQDELAQQLAISKQAISKIETKGESAQIKDCNLNPLATALGCSVEYLTGETDCFNEYKADDGKVLRQAFIPSANYRLRGTEYDLLPVEEQILITELNDMLIHFNLSQLKMVKKFCFAISENESPL